MGLKGYRHSVYQCFLFFFFFNDTATTEIYTLSLHDALPICRRLPGLGRAGSPAGTGCAPPDRKSTRLNSSHVSISYAVFCLKKKILIYVVEMCVNSMILFFLLLVFFSFF